MCQCWARINVNGGARLHEPRAKETSFRKVDDEDFEARKSGHGWVPLKARYGRASPGAGGLSPQSQSVSHAKAQLVTDRNAAAHRYMCGAKFCLISHRGELVFRRANLLAGEDELRGIDGLVVE
jgi:hypothetical protein